MTGLTAMLPAESDNDNTKAEEQPLYYFEAGRLVYKAAYHLERGHCCGSGCRHCPYEPRHIVGNTQVRP